MQECCCNQGLKQISCMQPENVLTSFATSAVVTSQEYMAWQLTLLTKVIVVYSSTNVVICLCECDCVSVWSYR